MLTHSEHFPITYFGKYFFQVVFGHYPGRNSIAEEYKISYNASRINSDHLTHAAEGTVFLVVVSNVTQRSTPVTHPDLIHCMLILGPNVAEVVPVPDDIVSPCVSKCNTQGNLDISH